MATTRRRFLQSTLGTSSLLSLAPAVPGFLLTSSAQAAEQKGENILVVLQLSGGNDGLNTVVPFGDDAYYSNRHTLAVGRGAVLKIDDYVGLHPACEGMFELLQEGQLGIVQGVGYPNPNRSHFESMDIWHTALRNPGRKLDGWLGRYLDHAARKAGGDVPALHLGGEKQPLALRAQHVAVPSVSSLESFRLQDGGNRELRESILQAGKVERGTSNELLSFMQQSTLSALASSEQVQEALHGYRSTVSYPGSRLGQRLKTVAQLIDAGLSTKIYYLELGGFDTHSDQADAHAALLRQVSSSVAAFVKDLAGHGHAERVLVATFSEFGRRVKENGSRGTDHGAAAPLFLAGGKVKSGLIGKHPSLTSLDDGDLKFHTDFRRVYATLLQDWLGCDSARVLGKPHEPLSLLA